MKTLDWMLGVPVCLCLDLVKKVADLIPGRRYHQPRKILVMKYFGMGSILLASPLLRALRQQHPEATISFLTFASNRSIVERLKLVDRVYLLRTDSLLNFVGDLARNLWQIRCERYDVTIDMEFFAKFSTIMTYLSGSPKRIGYFLRQIWRGDLLTDHIYYNHFKHITEIFAALATPLGVTVTDYSLTPPAISQAEQASATEVLAAHGISNEQPLIAFNVNASDLSYERRWPKEQFRALALALAKEVSATIIFVGGDGDAAYVAEVLAGLPRHERIINLAGKTSLGELLAIIRRCALFITNDSGPLHLAAAYEIPTVSFFGPESPTLYGPKGGEALVFYEGIYCSPCLNVFNVKTAPCSGENICMQTINSDDVLVAIRTRFPQFWTCVEPVEMAGQEERNACVRE